jgi:zinc transport system substrate-binding protein
MRVGRCQLATKVTGTMNTVSNVRHVLLICAVVLSAACGPSSEPAAGGPPLVVATFYPLYEFARQVGGDRVEVVALVPPGAEPHEWEPAPTDIVRLQHARVFVYNDAGLEPWVDRLRGQVIPRDAVVVNATEGLPLVQADLPRHGAPPDGGGNVPGRAHDPHVWLDPVLASSQVELVRRGLARADPAGAGAYADNARRYTAALDTLHRAFEQGLADCGRRDFVVSHAAFGYLARRYRLTPVPVMGLAPESEPSPAEMAAIVRFMRRQHATHVFFETLVSTKLAETLAREVGARTLVLNPVEGLTREEAAAGKTYVSLMQANLANLRIALGCR